MQVKETHYEKNINCKKNVTKIMEGAAFNFFFLLERFLIEKWYAVFKLNYLMQNECSSSFQFLKNIFDILTGMLIEIFQ